MFAAEARSRADSFWAEHPPADVLIAFGAASLFLLVCAIAIKASARTEGLPQAPETAQAMSAPVKVVPILDLDSPLLKLGGKPDPTKLPDRWVKKGARPRAEQKAQVSSAADKSLEAIPPPDLPVAKTATPPP